MPFSISTNIINGIFVLLAFICIVLLIKSFFFNKSSPAQKSSTLSNISSEEIAYNENIVEEIKKPDYSYLDEKNKKLSFKERIELSWKFLANIRNKILNHFSSLDKERIKQCGNIMKQYGMRYEHEVDNSARAENKEQLTIRDKDDKNMQQGV